MDENTVREIWRIYDIMQVKKTMIQAAEGQVDGFMGWMREQYPFLKQDEKIHRASPPSQPRVQTGIQRVGGWAALALLGGGKDEKQNLPN